EQIEYMKYLAPSFLIISAFLFALITQLMTNFLLVRLRFTIKRWKPFHEWSLPRNLIWYYLIALFLTIIGLEEGTTLFVAVANLLLVLENAMVLQGFFVIFAFTKIKGWSLA